MDELLTVAQAARHFQVHPQTIRTWVRKGLLKRRKLPGGGVRFASADLEAAAPPTMGRPRKEPRMGGEEDGDGR